MSDVYGVFKLFDFRSSLDDLKGDCHDEANCLLDNERGSPVWRGYKHSKERTMRIFAGNLSLRTLRGKHFNREDFTLGTAHNWPMVPAV